MTSETLDLLAFSDTHFVNVDDYRTEVMESFLTRLDEEGNMIDGVVIGGDILDRLPDQRSSLDAQILNKMFGDLSKKGSRHGFETYAVQGNHDYDAYQDIDFPNVHNVHIDRMDIGDTGFSIIGYGAERFDVGPEIRYDEFDSLEDVGHDELEMQLAQTSSVDEMMENLGVADHEKKEFSSQAERYLDLYDRLSAEIESSPTDRNILLSHIAPFNTSLDQKKIDGVPKDHYGSIVVKNVLNNYPVSCSINGHHDLEGIEAIDEENKRFMFSLPDAKPYRVSIGDGFGYEAL